MKKLTFLLLITVLASCNTHDFPLQEELLGLEDTPITRQDNSSDNDGSDDQWSFIEEEDNGDFDDGDGNASGGENKSKYCCNRRYSIYNFPFNYIIEIQLTKTASGASAELTGFRIVDTAEGYAYYHDNCDVSYDGETLEITILSYYLTLEIFHNTEVDHEELYLESTKTLTINIPSPNI